MIHTYRAIYWRAGGDAGHWYDIKVSLYRNDSIQLDLFTEGGLLFQEITRPFPDNIELPQLYYDRTVAIYSNGENDSLLEALVNSSIVVEPMDRIAYGESVLHVCLLDPEIKQLIKPNGTRSQQISELIRDISEVNNGKQ